MPNAKRYDEDNLDDRGLLKDKHSLRVDLTMMDSLSRAVHEHYADDALQPARIVDSYGGITQLNQPGPRYLVAGSKTVDHAIATTRQVMRDRAYAASVEDACNAWKATGTSDREIERKHSVGDERTNAWLDQLDDLTTAWSRRK
jgi:hypothetical protein